MNPLVQQASILENRDICNLTKKNCRLFCFVVVFNIENLEITLNVQQ